MKRTLRWLAPIVAAVCIAAGVVAVPHGAAADLPPPRTPRPTVPQPPPSPLPPIVVMSVGDSLTEGTDPATKGTPLASYRPELSRLMDLTGQPHTWVIQALGGTKCSYWAARMAGLLVTYHPSLVLLDCGTNDVPGVDNTEADVRIILAAVASYNAVGHHTLLVVALIGQPDMDSPTNTIRPWIWNWMHDTSAAIGRALADYPAVPVTDMVRVPNNKEWLQDDGIHLTARSEAAYGQLFYRAAAPRMGWLTIEDMRAQSMCGLSGHWRDTPWPTPDGVVYRVCTLA